jgi:hypothetical protein
MATTPVSPKVKAGANWAAYATLALTLLSTVTPDNLAFLGAYAPLAYGVVIAGTYAIGAYLKADPLREPAPASAPEVTAPEVTAPEVIAPEVAPTV